MTTTSPTPTSLTRAPLPASAAGGHRAAAPLDALGTRSALTQWALETARRTVGFGTDVDATLWWCIDVGKRAPHVGTGRTGELWELLAEIGRASCRERVSLNV